MSSTEDQSDILAAWARAETMSGECNGVVEGLPVISAARAFIDVGGRGMNGG